MSPDKDPKDRWIRRFQPNPTSAVRLVCFPHAGGAASYFHPVARALAPVAEVLAVQYPGRQDRSQEPLIDDMGRMADGVFAALRTWDDRPLAFFGHSMGAIVAFEVARRWQRTLRKPPAVLFVSGNRAPCNRREPEAVHLAEDSVLMEDVKDLGGTDLSILEGDEELLGLILPSIRSDYRAIETYVGPEDATLNCPIVALTADDDRTVSVEEMREWERHTTRSFDLRVFSGGHFYLSEHEKEINDLLAERLATVGLPAI